MEKTAKKQVLDNIDEKKPQTSRKIMDPERDINHLLENQITPSTIKILMGQFNKSSAEYKRLEKEYKNFLLKKNMRPGVIRSDDNNKKNNKWEEKKAKSYFISTSYRVQKKTPLDLMKEKKQQKNKTDIYDLGYEPYKEIFEDQFEELKQESTLDQNLQNQIETEVKANKKEKNYRKTSDEVNEILKENCPILTQQINELKRHGLSVVDFALETDEKINVIKEENELTIELIKDSFADEQIDRTTFVSNESKPIEKPVAVKLVRKVLKPSISQTSFLDNKNTINKKPSIISKNSSSNNLNQNFKKPIINQTFANPGFINPSSKIKQSENKQQDLPYVTNVEEKKQPKFVQEIETKKRLEKYVNSLKDQQTNTNNISFRKEISELNQLVNQEKQIRANKSNWETKNDNEIAPSINVSEDQQTNVNNDYFDKNNENETEQIVAFEKQPKFVQEIETKKRLEKYANSLKAKQTNEFSTSLKDEIKELNDLIQQEGKITSNNQLLDVQIQQQKEISDSLFEKYNQLTEQEEAELHLLKKIKSNDGNNISQSLLEQNEEYQLLLKLKKAIEDNEKSLVDSLKRQVELSQIVKIKHSQ